MFTYRHKETGAVIVVQSAITAPHWEEVKPVAKKTTKKKDVKKVD